MKKVCGKIVSARYLILVISLLLLIPAAIGFVKTRINYDILYYLPSDIETMKGQDILLSDFGKGAYALFVAEDMKDKDAAELKEKLEKVDGVAEVLWYTSFADASIPKEMLPDKINDFYNSNNATLMAVFFSGTTSSDETMKAVEEMRKIAGEQCFLSGMSAIVTDTKNLVESEVFIYVAIATGLALIVMAITLDSFLVPLLFLFSIGVAIIYNLGTNIIKGEISFITMSLAAVLQLGVTMDYSIFLYESYKEKKNEIADHKAAMAEAVYATINSVIGSSLTTVAGFVALCFMTFTLGLDLGIVMAKGVVLGVICCITLLPALLLIFDRAIEKTSHRAVSFSFGRIAGFVVKYFWIFAILMIVLWVPSIAGYENMNVYYKLDASLPGDLPSVRANEELKKHFNVSSIHMALLRSDLGKKEVKELAKEIENTKGVGLCLGMDSIVGSLVPDEMVPEKLASKLKSENYQLLLITSDYEVASDEMNRQVEKLSDTVKKYDEKGMLIGEAACTKDLIRITDKDFQVVNIVSIGLIFILIMFVLRSVTLPVILVSVIELAIYINLGLCTFLGQTQSFIASIVIGTIQLGATVDYAILMTNRYKKDRISGMDSREAAKEALISSIPSIVTSALCFFAATIGVGIYSDVDLISSLCMLLARGAIISMLVVAFILPSMYVIFDKVIIRTTMGMKDCIKPAGKKAMA